jgi:hypothetical protein
VGIFVEQPTGANRIISLYENTIASLPLLNSDVDINGILSLLLKLTQLLL